MSYDNYLFAWEEQNQLDQDTEFSGQLQNKTVKCNSRSSNISERRKWVPEEDTQLVKLIKKYGTKNWRVVASHLKERTPKQCRERWINHLDPEIVKGKLTAEEWNLVMESQEEIGNRWSEIAKLLPGRTPNQIKNVWHAMMRRETKQRNPKRKLSGIDQMIDHSSSEDDISESDTEYPVLKKQKTSASSPDTPELPLSKLDVLVEIALSYYEMEQGAQMDSMPPKMASKHDSDELSDPSLDNEEFDEIVDKSLKCDYWSC